MSGDSGEGYPKKSLVVHHHEIDGATNNGQRLSGGSIGGGSIGRKCTAREKTLSLCVILLALFSFGLLTYLAYSGLPILTTGWNEEATVSNFLGVCDSKECVEISFRALQAGNFGANPCQDFYHFACSKWQHDNPITTEQFFHAANINMIKDRVDLKIKELLEVPNKETDEKETKIAGGKKKYSMEKNVRAFYQSCLNYVHPDENVLIAELLNSLGGYQWSETWNEAQFDLTNVTLKFLRLNAAPLFDIMLDIDAKNRSRFALIVELPRPTSLVPNLFHSSVAEDHDFLFQMEHSLNRYKLNEDIIDSPNFKLQNPHINLTNGKNIVDRQFLYKMITDNVESKKMYQLKSLVRKVCYMMNVSDEECQADINDITMIVTTIQKFLPSQRTRKFWKQQNLVYNKYTIDSLESQFGPIDWKHLLGSLVRGNSADDFIFDRDAVNWKDVAGTVYVPYPDYLRRLFTYIQFTNKRVLYNSMLMLYVRDMLNDLMDRGKKEPPSSSKPSTTTPNPNPRPSVEEPRWKFCVDSTKSVFAMELSSLYLRTFDPAHLRRTRAEVEEIFRNVKEALKLFLHQSSWLEKNDVKARHNALRKIETLKGNFLAPSFYFREDFLDDSIKSIQISSTDFFSNIRLVYKTFREQMYRLFRSPVDEDRVTWAFVTFPFIVNAFYIQQFNSIVIPLAFLTSPQYTVGAPKYINYATIALTIAHEALHALDGSGSDFDADGRLQEWVSDARGFLREKSVCVAKQYSDSFRKLIPFYQTHVPIQVDGNLTQNENMADIAGLQVALNAYHKYRESLNKDELRDAELKLPGLNYTLSQTFFLSVAQAYCSNISPMGYVVLLEMDEHTPHPERINGMMMNSVEFSQAFQCPLGSRMRPVNRCLW